MRGFQICCIWILFFSTKVDFHFFWNGEKHCTLCFCLLHLQQLCKKIITVLCWSDTRYCSCSSLVFSPTHAFTLSGFVPPPDTAYTLHIFFLWWFFFFTSTLQHFVFKTLWGKSEYGKLWHKTPRCRDSFWGTIWSQTLRFSHIFSGGQQ